MRFFCGGPEHDLPGTFSRTTSAMLNTNKETNENKLVFF